MTILEVVEILALIIAAIGLGYKFGRDVGKKENRPSNQDRAVC